jgi:hypothetical protein
MILSKLVALSYIEIKEVRFTGYLIPEPRECYNCGSKVYARDCITQQQQEDRIRRDMSKCIGNVLIVEGDWKQWNIWTVF